jgi:AraC-like DNA-binding protein
MPLVALLDRLTGPTFDGKATTAIDGVHIHRVWHPGPPRYHMQRPLFAVIAQGSKRILVGSERYEYDSFHYLVSSVDLPVAGQVVTASPERPYLGMRLDIDLSLVRELIHDASLPPPGNTAATAPGVCVAPLTDVILDPVLRLLRLLDTPADIPVLAPMIKREILYRLLTSGHGERLLQFALQDSHTLRVAKAITLLRENFREPLRVDTLAATAHMSVSSFHQHFKAVTTMSPLQYQKQLRLHEARRLMFAGDGDVAHAAYSVGYESASQFTREYGRLFGAPPLRDRRRWLAEPGGAVQE